MHPYGSSFARTVLGTGMKLSRQHSNKVKRSLHHLKSLHTTTPTVQQSSPLIHHQQGWEQFFFKHKIMDIPLWCWKKLCCHQNGSAGLNLGMRTPWRVCPWTQVYHGNRSQATCPTPHNNRLVKDTPSNTALLPSNDAIQPWSLAHSW